jgi:hypothetical protein
LYQQGKLRFPGRLAALAEGTAFAAWLDPLQAKDWVVYAKPPFGGPEQVLKYLARYTHRVAISNQRLEALADGKVTFRYKAYAEGQEQKRMTLSAEEFLRRFLQHVLPKGFVKIRHFGLLSNRHREERLQLSRRLLLVPLVLAAASQELTTMPEEREAPACPHCGGRRWSRREALAKVVNGSCVPLQKNGESSQGERGDNST